jgi:hypothetical protein
MRGFRLMAAGVVAAACLPVLCLAPGRTASADPGGAGPAPGGPGAAATSLTLEVPQVVTSAAPMTMRAAVSPAPAGGTVDFAIPGTDSPGCAAAPVDPGTGIATCTAAAPSTAGLEYVHASYSGDGGSLPSGDSGVGILVSGTGTVHVEVISGDAQLFPVGGGPPAQPLIARVVDGAGAPVPYALVAWGGSQGASGGGELGWAGADADGFASPPGAYAAEAGPFTLTASAYGGLDRLAAGQAAGPSAVFHETAAYSANSSDLFVRLDAPASASRGSRVSATLTLATRGPDNGYQITAAVLLPAGAQSVSTGGGTAFGPLIYYTLPTITGGDLRTATISYIATVAGPATIYFGAVDDTADPDPTNNLVQATTAIAN